MLGEDNVNKFTVLLDLLKENPHFESVGLTMSINSNDENIDTQKIEIVIPSKQLIQGFNDFNYNLINKAQDEFFNQLIFAIDLNKYYEIYPRLKPWMDDTKYCIFENDIVNEKFLIHAINFTAEEASNFLQVIGQVENETELCKEIRLPNGNQLIMELQTEGMKQIHFIKNIINGSFLAGKEVPPIVK